MTVEKAMPYWQCRIGNAKTHQPVKFGEFSGREVLLHHPSRRDIVGEPFT
jgi:hypothetical protein